jgi:hypothetical protein
VYSLVTISLVTVFFLLSRFLAILSKKIVNRVLDQTLFENKKKNFVHKSHFKELIEKDLKLDLHLETDYLFVSLFFNIYIIIHPYSSQISPNE